MLTVRQMLHELCPQHACTRRQKVSLEFLTSSSVTVRATLVSRKKVVPKPTTQGHLRRHDKAL